MKPIEIQVTHCSKGHTLHYGQVFSKDNKWIVYDTRNIESQIGSTGHIEMVNIETGVTVSLYCTTHQTEYGPGVGAAAFSPIDDQVIFIHGIRNADKERPYGFTRRTCFAIDINRPGVPRFMDARNIIPPFTPGALRGGTHAYFWSGDGTRISFTYNDYVLEQLAQTNPHVKDLRTVGVMVPGQVQVTEDGDQENNSGQMFSVLVASVTENPKPCSDEIDKAFDECWIGLNGYIKENGSRQKYAIAFQGNVKDENNRSKTEVFVIDLPEEPFVASAGKPLEGTPSTRPNVPAGIRQRRITFTDKGISGPRHWLGSTKDGSLILFLAADKDERIQVYGVSPLGGVIQQFTFNEIGLESGFAIHPASTHIAYAADNSLFITDMVTRESIRVTKRYEDAARPVGAIVWSNDGNYIAYNRYVNNGSGNFLQIFVLDLTH